MLQALVFARFRRGLKQVASLVTLTFRLVPHAMQLACFSCSIFKVKCLAVRNFNDSMYKSPFTKLEIPQPDLDIKFLVECTDGIFQFYQTECKVDDDKID